MLKPDYVNKYSPVGAVTVSPKGTALVMRKPNPNPKPPKVSGNKKAISRLSQSSLNRLAFIAMETSTQFKSLLTLTFLCTPTAVEAKAFLNRLIVFLGRKVKRAIKFLWFMEFSKMGSVHFHILLDIPQCKQLQTRIAHFWARLQQPLNVCYSTLRGKRRVLKTQDSVRKVHEHPKTWENLRHPEGAARYALKYATKPHQKYPPVWMKLTGRFWGTDRETGKIDFSKWETIPIGEKDLRTFLWTFDHKVKKWDVIPKIIWNFPHKAEQTKE